MKEEEWLESAEPEAMLRFLGEKCSERKLRLFACACCRRILPILTDKSRLAIEVGEKHADGLVEQMQCEQVQFLAYQAVEEALLRYERSLDNATRSDSYCNLVEAKAVSSSLLDNTVARPWVNAVNAAHYVADGYQFLPTQPDQEQSLLIPDIFGNPFRPVTFDVSCCTPTVTALATAIYTDRRFEDLPVLADALEEAGCADAEILGHLRGPGPHARGCWAVDLALGKN